MALTLEHYRLARLDNLELLYFPEVKEAYPRHFHHEYAICFMTSGQVQTQYRGSTHCSHLHSFTVMNPDEVHAGCMGQHEKASYFSFYPSLSLVKKLMQDSFATEQLPYFKHPIIADKLLQQRFEAFVQATASTLEMESHFLLLLEHMIRHYADVSFSLRDTGHEPRAIKDARTYLHAHFARDIRLHDLADSVQLNRSYFIRAFKRQTGLSPHRYLLHLRLQEARKRLSEGQVISQVALETGFADQSHLTRAFKAAFAITPGRYARVTFVQDKTR